MTGRDAALFDAISRGDGEAVRTLLAGDRDLSCARHESGVTAILWAL